MDEAKAAVGCMDGAGRGREEGGKASAGEGVVLLQSTYRHPCRRLCYVCSTYVYVCLWGCTCVFYCRCTRYGIPCS